MRDKLRDKERLLHILHAIAKIDEFLRDKTKEDFEFDSLLYHAVVHNLEHVGEASYMLTKEFKENHPSTPWNKIIGMRHYLVHGYFQVSVDEVWNTVKKDLIPLRKQIEEYMQEL